MKYLWLLFMFLISYPNLSQNPKPNSLRKLSKMVWNDEFNYQGLPDSSKWGYEVGLLRDLEKQYYTKNRLENAVVKGGCLRIRSVKERFRNPAFKKYKNEKYPSKYLNTPSDSIPGWVKNRFDSIINYTSASLVTLKKASWTYGRVEVRAKLPVGKGTWPIIWMMGINFESVGWPDCGEIDIM